MPAAKRKAIRTPDQPDLLIEHDARLDQDKPALRLEEYIFEKYGVRLGRTTIRSRVVHARMALILGAQGLIDKLPNQAQSLAIYSLPRESWIPFIKKIRFNPGEKISADKIRKHTEAYAREFELPLRGEPVRERKESSPESMTQQLLLPLDDLNAGSPKVKDSSEPVVSAPPSQEKSPKALESKLLQCLRGVLPQELPRYVVKAARQQHQQPEKIFLHELRKSLNAPKESDARLNRIWHLIEGTTPDLAKKIVDQGLRHILGPAEQRTKHRILNRKKIRKQTRVTIDFPKKSHAPSSEHIPR